jgi:CRP-like cAMP-binding protein
VAPKIRLVTPLERTLYLKTLQPLRDLLPADLAEIAADAEEQYFRKGDALYRLGEPLRCVHIITEGRVRVSGDDVGTVTLGERDPLGALTLLSRNESGLDAVAETDVRTLMIPDQVLFDLFEDNFTILHNQIVGLARRTLEARKNIADGTVLAPAEELDFRFTRQMDLVERILFMRRGGGFQEQNMDALMQLAMTFQEVELEAGRTLWRAGDPAGFSTILLHGTVNCRLENGNRFQAGPGYPLGNLESQALSSRWYDAVTETPVLALSGHTDAFIDVLEDHFSLALDFLSTLARNLMHILRDERSGKDRHAVA